MVAIAVGIPIAAALNVILSTALDLLSISSWIDSGRSEAFFLGDGSYTAEKQLDSAFTIAAPPP